MKWVKQRKWTKEELKWLEENFDTMTYIEMGKALNRTPNSVSQKCYNLRQNTKEGGNDA